MAQMFDVGRTLRLIGERLTVRPVRILVTYGVTADHLTILGLAMALIASAMVLFSWYQVAGMFLLIAGACDMFDGSVARATNTSRPSGAFLDSVLDRPSDLVPLLSITAMAAWHHQIWCLSFGTAAVMVSHLIPYVKARGESLGCVVTLGLMPRAARFTLIFIGLMTGPVGLVTCLALITLGGAWTIYERMRTCFQQLR